MYWIIGQNSGNEFHILLFTIIIKLHFFPRQCTTGTLVHYFSIDIKSKKQSTMRSAHMCEQLTQYNLSDIWKTIFRDQKFI